MVNPNHVGTLVRVKENLRGKAGELFRANLNNLRYGLCVIK